MNLPNKITLSRIVAIVAILIAVFVMYIVNLVNPSFVIEAWKLGDAEINPVFLGLLVFFILACITDAMDGHIARSRHLVTNLGKFMDPVADKLLVNSMLVFLIAPNLFAPYALGQVANVSVWCAILMIARDIVVEALRFIAAQKKVVIAANIFGKLKTVFQMVAICFVLANGFPFSYFDAGFKEGLRISDFLVYIATIISVISGVIYVIEGRDALTDKKKED